MKCVITVCISSMLLLLAGCSDKPGLLRVDSRAATAYSADLTYNFFNKTYQDKGPTTIGVSARTHHMAGTFKQNIVAGDSVGITHQTTFNGPTTIIGDAELQHSELRVNGEFYTGGRKGSVVLGAGLLSQEVALDIKDASQQDRATTSIGVPFFLMAGYRYRPIENLYLELLVRMGINFAIFENASYSESNYSLCYSPIKQATLCGGYRGVSIYEESHTLSNLEMHMSGPVAELRFQF